MAINDSTRKYIEERAKASGIDVDKLMIEPDDEKAVFWDVYVTYYGAADEEFSLGNTLYVVNIMDWLAENVAIEATIESDIDGTQIEWTIEAYLANRLEGDLAIVRITDQDRGPVGCAWGVGGDPASGCDRTVTGHDLLCDTHRKAMRDLEAHAGLDLT